MRWWLSVWNDPQGPSQTCRTWMASPPVARHQRPMPGVAPTQRHKSFPSASATARLWWSSLCLLHQMIRVPWKKGTHQLNIIGNSRWTICNIVFLVGSSSPVRLQPKWALTWLTRSRITLLPEWCGPSYRWTAWVNHGKSLNHQWAIVHIHTFKAWIGGISPQNMAL